MAERHTLAALVAAGVVGYVDRDGGVELPKIDALGTAGTYGLAAWILGRATGSKMAQHAATGLLSVAVYDFVRRER